MKKIYMILAAMTLLSLSLNAQTRAVETNTYTYTLPNNNAFSTSGGTATLGDFIWTYSSFTYKGWENTRGMQIGSRNNPTSTFTLSTSEIPGTITSITVGANAYNANATIRATVGGAAFGTTQNLSSGNSAATNTFTGSASGEIVITWTNVNNGRAMYFKSIEVTYEVDDPNTANLDLFSNTTDANMCLPVYGGYHDHTQHNQMVYPASLLTDMVGKKIKSMTFYPASVTDNDGTFSGINFYNGSVTFKMMEVTGSTGFNSSNPSFITGSMTTVKTVTMPSSANTSATTWKITFDQEYEYNGGDLVIDVTNATGDYKRTYFYTGTTSIAYPGYYTYSGSTGSDNVAVDYIPKVTFTYDNTTTATIAITPESQTINDATPGSLTVTGTDIDGNISVSAGTDWSVNPTSLSSTGGNVSVTYTGRALSASTTVTASATGATDATATVDYVADLYIVTDNGVTDNWDFTNGTHMTYDNGIYTATFTATADNTYILFARMLGNGVNFNTRYVFGPDSNGDWWLNGDSGNGTIDTDDDDPIKIVNSGTYTVTIDATNGTFTIERLVPALTAPTDVNVGTNEGAGTSTTVNISGSNLNEDLTVSVSGEGFSVSPTTLTAADVMAGTTVTVTYNGTNENATGTLTISSGEVSVTVDLTASYAAPTPELTAPVDDSTVNVGTNYGRGVSKTINIKGNNLSQDLTVSVTGAGFTVSRDVTITAAEANAGKDVIVTYNGANANATGELTISSSEVSATVHLTASYATSGAITVCDGEYYAGMLPVAGLYYDETEHNQMVYPASELADMEGMHITSMTFYPTTGTYTNPNNNQQTDYSGINFYGGSVTFKLMNLSSGTSSFADENPTLITGTMTPVATITPTANTSATTWVITFDQPFEYTGGDLLIDVTTTAGTWSPSYFVVDEVNGNLGAMNCSYNGTNYYYGLDYLPKVTFDFNNGETPPEPAVEGGLLRLHLLFCDQLKANIPDDNKHPDAYGYVLKFEPQGGETQESGKVKVDIQKTDCEVMGYYTLDQIDRDTNRGLTMDVLTADVQFDLTATNDMLNYYYLQGKENGYPELDKDYLSQLHRQEDFTYREMYEDSYEFDQVFNSGEHHYFNSAAEPIIGQYGVASKFVSYAPSVTTWGIQRRYFELDGKDNTYGAPVWKTAVGKVEMDSQAKPVVERQTNQWNSVNWGSGDNAASLYMLDNVKAIGYLPPTNLTKVEFEPYMFRIFVESKNGLLRPYKVVPAVEGSATEGEHLEAADGELTEADMKGPICVWSGYIKYDNDGNPIDDAVNGVELSCNDINGPFTYLKKKVNRSSSTWDKDENNAMFGALDALAISGYDAQGKPILNNNITEDDLKIFVRFYYSVKGELADHTPWSRAEGSRSGNGAESGAKAPDPATGVNEIVYHGEIVETIYYNVQGMMSDKPFEGVNIIVNRYSDGTSSVSKVVK